MKKESVDVLIIGAGLSGIGAACHFRRNLPRKRIAILEGRQAMGGTWDLFRYPGVRSDSDMFTLGYSFKPWLDPKSIADGADIKTYIEVTAREYGVDKLVRFGHRCLRASWCTDAARWTVDVQRQDNGETLQIECSFLLGCTGYYNYAAGYTPEFKGTERFRGQIVHPQHWPQDLDYAGKRVVVIGSGATAVTLIPAMAEQCEHIVMLQRSPTYVSSVPRRDWMASRLLKLLPEKLAYRLLRTRNIGFQLLFYRLAKSRPRAVRRLLLQQAKKQLGDGFDMKHFSPRYNPWDERLCAVPGGDLFKALRRGKASVVTDQIVSFTEQGILLQSGQELPADIIITATGLDLQLLGGMTLTLDGHPVDMANTINYKGTMFRDIPNFAMVFGYTNASWTLKADLTIEYVIRLLKLMDKKRMGQVTPRLGGSDIGDEPFLDMQSGYFQRAIARLPKQGSKTPWKLHQNYALDLALLRYGDMEDGYMTFSNPY